MSEMEDKLGTILNNPQMMQQIMAMAQSLNQGQSTGSGNGGNNNPEPEKSQSTPSIDPRMLQSLAGFAQKSSVDKNQQTLLNALCPYLSQNRVGKLEKAMRAAKIAGLASSFLNSGGLQLLTGR